LGASAAVLIKPSDADTPDLSSVADCDLRVLALLSIRLGRPSVLATLFVGQSVNNR